MNRRTGSVLILAAAALLTSACNRRVTHGNASSLGASISSDGRYVAFYSAATDLVPGVDDSGTDTDVFLHDLQTKTTVRLTNGVSGSFTPDVAAEGAYVAYMSYASNLVVPNDETVDTADIFRWEAATGTTRRITDGVAGYAENPAISDDGRFIVFDSTSDDHVPGDTNGRIDVFLWDATTDTVQRISDEGSQPAISADGSRVAYRGPDGLHLYDTANATSTVIVPTTTFLRDVSISGDGSKVAFTSQASDLVPGDTNEQEDLFLWDEATGEVTRLAGAVDPPPLEIWSIRYPSISDDGSAIAFQSRANDLPGAPTPSGTTEVFTVDTTTGVIQVVTHGGRSENPSISGDGRYIAYHTFATEMAPPDTNNRHDVLVWDRQHFVD